MENFVLDNEYQGLYRLKHIGNIQRSKVTIKFKPRHPGFYIFLNKFWLVSENFTGDQISFYTNNIKGLYIILIRYNKILERYSDHKFKYTNSKDHYYWIEDITIEDIQSPTLWICGCSHSYNHPYLPYYSWAQYLQSMVRDKFSILNLSVSGESFIYQKKKIEKIITPGIKEGDYIFLMYSAIDFKKQNIQNLAEKYNDFFRKYQGFKIFFVTQHGCPKYPERCIKETEELKELLDPGPEFITTCPDKELGSPENFACYSSHTNYYGSKYITEKYFKFLYDNNK